MTTTTLSILLFAALFTLVMVILSRRITLKWRKQNYVFIIALSTNIMAMAQSQLRAPEQEHFIVTASFDWADKMPSDHQKNILHDYGLNYHIEAGIQSAIGNLIGMEAKVGYEGFPSLYGGYSAFTGSFGLRMVYGYNEEWQYYVGWRASKVYRTSETLGTAYRWNSGLELKVTRDIGESLFLGLRTTFEKANDQEIFNWPVKTRWGGYVVVGFKLFNL